MKYLTPALIKAGYAITVVFFLCGSADAWAEWRDWWQTPEQQAKAALEDNDTDTLKRVAPDAAWQGVAEHNNANYEAAAATFNEVAIRQDSAGNTLEATQALYNRGVSEVRSGQYEKAVNSFDQVLQRSPQFDDAQHNRDIASQLMQQQQPPPSESRSDSEQSDESGDESDDSAASDSDSQDPSEQQTPSEQGQQSQSGEQQPSESEQNTTPERSEPGEQQVDDSDTAEAESEEQRLKDEQAARDALQAESQAGDDSDDEAQRDTDEQVNATLQEEPLSESEQATEQWLRRIPDDPAGLLRRKLEQSHQAEYPEVRDAQEPW